MLFTNTFYLGLLASVTQAAHLYASVPQEQAIRVSNFSYTGAETGPLNWGNLAGWTDAVRDCSTGNNQSPINLDDSILGGSGVSITYPDGQSFVLENIGTTLEAHLPGTSAFSVTFNQRPFGFNNFHFHTPSEHRLNGESFPLEMHIVNSANDPSNNVVLTILFNVGTTDNAFISSVLVNEGAVRNPGEESTTGAIDWTPIRNAFDMAAPRKSYSGSLTTPPCTENTSFIIATTPMTLSNAQYTTIKNIIKFNSRYTQNTLGDGNLLQIPQA